MQQAAHIFAAITNPKASPNQIGNALRGPLIRRVPAGLGAARQQARKFRQSVTGQPRPAPGTSLAPQSRCSPPTIVLRPLMNGLTADSQSTGDDGQRLPRLDVRQSRQAARLQLWRISSHKTQHAPHGCGWALLKQSGQGGATVRADLQRILCQRATEPK
jgi:hypothetical protein